MNGGPPPNGIPPKRELEAPAVRWGTLVVILVLHALIIGGTVFWGGGCSSTDKPKEKQYKVKLSGSPPPPPPEPQVTPPPKPQPPEPVVSPPQPTPQPPEPQVTPPPKPQPAEPVVKHRPKKPQPKEPKVKNRPKKPQPKEPKVKNRPRKPQPPEPQVRNRKNRQNRSSTHKPQNTKAKQKNSGVYQPANNGQKFDPKKKYGPPNSRGSNPNAPPSKQPGPGDDPAKNQKWYEKVSGDVYNCWTPPEGVFWKGAPPQATVELYVAADGRVLSSRLVTPSGNARMDATIRQMLSALNRVTPPPDGEQKIRVLLIPE